MDDLISRQVTIDMLAAMQGQCTNKAALIQNSKIWRQIKDLPSAQPEIIRCKDCKYACKWRDEESAKKFGQIYECARGVLNCPKPEDFCSKAERRTNGSSN